MRGEKWVSYYEHTPVSQIGSDFDGVSAVRTQSYLPNLTELHKHAHIKESWLNISCHCQIPSGQSCLCCSYSVTPPVWFWLTRILKHFGSVQVLLRAACLAFPPLPCNQVYADGGVRVSLWVCLKVLRSTRVFSEREVQDWHAHSSHLPPDSSQCQIINALWPVSLPLPYCLSCKEAVQTPARNTIVIKCGGVWKVEWNVLFKDLVYILRQASFLAKSSQRESLFPLKCSSCSKPRRPYPLAHSGWCRRSHSGVTACGLPLPVNQLTAPPGVRNPYATVRKICFCTCKIKFGDTCQRCLSRVFASERQGTFKQLLVPL